MMMMISNQILPLFLILFLPTLSLLYIISVQSFLAGWHECSWTYLAKPITLRLALVVVAIAIGIAIPSSTTTSNDNDWLNVKYLFPTILLSIISIITIYRTRKIFVQGPKPTFKNMDEKVVLITGSNAGIGKETARQLLIMGATVIMACRSEKRAKEAMDDILRSIHVKRNDDDEKSQKSAKDRLIFLPCDVSDFNSVREAVSTFQKMNLPLDVLINNAGIMMGQRKTTTGDDNGLELTMACNHLGHFLLTNLLLPTMRKQKDSRVVIVTSSTYVLASDGIDLKDLNCEQKKYTMFSQYAQSKLANILMGKELLRREQAMMVKSDEKYSPVSVFMVHPGLVRTDVVRNMPWYLKYPNILFSFILTTLQKSPAAGAYTNVFCATSDEAKQFNGEYLSNSESFPTNDFANNKDDAIELWKLSEEMVGLNKKQSK